MTIEINGMAHVILTVSRFEVAREFYRKLLPEFGMKPVFDGDKLFYCVGARTAIGIEPCEPALAGERFVQQRVGLHHLCLRARSREDVDRCAALLKEMNATIVRGPQEGTWAPGYYYVLFEDPDGIRLEVNFVPGAGLLADGLSSTPVQATSEAPDPPSGFRAAPYNGDGPTIAQPWCWSISANSLSLISANLRCVRCCSSNNPPALPEYRETDVFSGGKYSFEAIAFSGRTRPK